MLTPLVCMKCDGRWLDDSHRCPSTPAETERELERVVVDRAIEWHNVASGKLTVPASAQWMVLDDFASAVEDLLRHREAP